jgi:ubiquinol oxidase
MSVAQRCPVLNEIHVAGQPPKLSHAALLEAERSTVNQLKQRMDPVTWLLVSVVNLLYGKAGSLGKFKVLELLAPLPYRAWEKAAYRVLSRFHKHTILAPNRTTRPTTS